MSRWVKGTPYEVKRVGEGYLPLLFIQFLHFRKYFINIVIPTSVFINSVIYCISVNNINSDIY